MSKTETKKTELERRLEEEAEADRKARNESTSEPEGAEHPEGIGPADTASPGAHESESFKAERDALADQLLRARAEFDNYRKRMAREAERTRQMAAESLIRDILPVVDHLELALKHADDHPGALGEGVALVLRQFHEVLGKHGVQPIPAEGEPFDPNVHEAVMQRETDGVPPESVVEEFQKGYRLGSIVLRPSKVVVSMGSPQAASAADELGEGEPPPEPSTEDGDPA